MTKETADPESLIRKLPIWKGRIEIEPLLGGITNRNFRVIDGDRQAVVRFGSDIPVHGVLRFNEHAASRAAAAAGISPAVLYAAPSLLVIDHISGRTYTAADVRSDRDRCVALARRAHREIPQHLRGPSLSFNVFHILRDYGHTLFEDRSRMVPGLPRLLGIAATLERTVGPIDLVFGHNDLLAANFIDDGSRLWLIDWDYAGWNTPLFDLGGLSSNNAFGAGERDAMLETYFGAPVTDGLRRRLQAMVCASLLREAMWSLVSESRSTIDFDYAAYTDENLRRFETEWAGFQEREAL